MTERFRITGATAFFSGSGLFGSTSAGSRLGIGTGTATPLTPLHVYGASTVHGAAGRGTVLVSNSDNTRQLQIGVNDTDSVAWIEGWVPGSGGLTLSLQPSGGRVGIGTISPTVTLDVNGDIKGTNITASGTVTVGNFGGSTNVMAKATNTAGIGRVVPLFTWSSTFGSNYELMTQTTPLGEGTWFVYLVGSVDSAGIESENPGLVMAKVWTVPASKWLTFATDGNAASNIATSNARSGFWSKIHDSLGTLRTSDVTRANVNTTNSWTEHTVNNNNAVSLVGQDSDSNSAAQGIVYNNKWVCPVNLVGYAIRIA
jgi:hypothetical protein